MSRILVYGNYSSPLVQPRGQVGAAGGHEVYWLSTHPVDSAPPHVHQLSAKLRKSLVVRSIAEPLMLRRLVAQLKPEFIHVHYASKGTGVFGIPDNQRLIVSTMGSDILPEAGYKGVYRRFTRRMLEKATTITSKSTQMDEAILKIGDYQSKLVRITWGIDVSLFQPMEDSRSFRERLNIPETDLVVLDPRGGSKLYNKHLILKAFSEFLHSEKAAATLIVCEMGEDSEYLRSLRLLASELGVADKVRFVGRLPYTDMPAYFSLADVTVSIPESDGLSQSLLECMACGSYPVFTDFPQYRELIRPPINGLLVSSKNPSDLAAALQEASRSPEIRRSARALNRDIVFTQFDSRKETQLVLDLYQRLLA